MTVFVIVIVIACISLLKGISTQASCNAEFCDPNWTPFPNMVSALRGYNIKIGNPIQDNGDPGFAGQIFAPTKINALGRIVLEDGITASELSFCRRSLTSKSFSTMNSYRKYISETSSSGVNLQIGTETEVTAGVNLKGIELGASKTIPKPFERAWSNSRDFGKLSKFFSEEHGMVSTSMGVCTVYEMRLDRFHMPPFTTAFKKAIIRLYTKRNETSHIRRNLFRQFITEYGTHYLTSTKMGAQFVYRTKFSKSAREQIDSSTLQNCNYVKGAKVFGIQVEKDRSGCTKTEEDKMNSLGRENIESVIITKGSRPTDIQNWATQKFIPIPLKFQLAPIVNLMTSEFIKKEDLRYDGKLISSLKIRKWFVPLYYNFCESMLLDCGEKKGCGVDDNCPIDTICKPGGNTHECGEWRKWRCTVNCGLGTQQRRTRTCRGCVGKLSQKRNFQCAPQTECYRPIQCHTKYTPANNDGGGNVHFLDRHYLNCGNGNTINHFKLERTDGNSKYRYKYRCCNTPLTCRYKRRYTNYNEVRGKDAVYLDRHSVNCHKQYMTAFGLERKRHSDDIRFSYNCCELSSRKTCYTQFSSFTDDGDGNTVYLDRQNVACRTGYGFAYFRLVRNGGHDRWRYHYTCCKALPL